MIMVGKMRAQEGFSITELLAVVFIIGLIVGIALFSFFRSSAGASRKAAAEIVTEDLRRAYSKAATAEKNGSDTNKKRDQYIVVFHGATGDPPNALMIVKGKFDGISAYKREPVPPEEREANRIVAGTYWIKPSTSSDIQIVPPPGGELIFQSKGSVMTVQPAGVHSVGIKAKSSGLTSNIYISDYGDISSD